MEIKIRQYEYKQIEVKSQLFMLPTETVYFFETGVRRSIRIKPIYTTWQKEQHNKDEEIWKVEITCVYLSFECKIEKFQIQVSEIEKIYHSKGDKYKDLIVSWVNDWFNSRTQEDFKNDLHGAITKINE